MTHLQGKVVVITGASSGIGRETAVTFARHGCSLVLGARRPDALEETAQLCERAGGRAIWRVGDVTREEHHADLVRTALERAGHIDVWINNAAVTAFSKIEQGPFGPHRRVIETNVCGAMLGARAVVPVFRRQKWGTLINVGSLLSKVAQPYVPSYVISKHALRGLSAVLRVELADEPDIHVCSIYPYAVDTPHFESGANHMGRQAHALPPAQAPEKVARAIVRLAQRPRREIHVPEYARLGLALHELFPNTTERLILRIIRNWHLSEVPEASSMGNVFEPSAAPASVHGTRKPLIGIPQLLLWASQELVKMEVQTAAHRARSWLDRVRSQLPFGQRPPGRPVSGSNGHSRSTRVVP